MESFENCTTKHYLKVVQKVCNCTPFALRNLSDTNDVVRLIFSFNHVIQIYFEDTQLQLGGDQMCCEYY